MKKILSIFFFIATSSTYASCNHFYPFGEPINKNYGSTYTLCRSEYVAEFSTSRKTSYWSATVISPNESKESQPRNDSFIGDPDLPISVRAMPKDYIRTGYDKGHLTAFKDIGGDKKAGDETFYMSNIIPQVPGNNRNGWRLLEEYVRQMTSKVGELYVITGPVYMSLPYQTIGNGVAVPDGMYKIIVSKKEKFFIAIMVPNIPIDESDLQKYVTDIRSIEKATGIRFFPFPPSGFTLKEKL